ncbi:DUF6773 family protein [Tindallia californiensis]|uniref:Uncharacterized protein n=1 Tax=Tindallia californiensis TaxID=159292 RepID=A0A1H3Q4P1_9FIRM|nr:DUF6773 family protein [Tindallia californiensis]SDZ07709.1 hypothetical protein SAMN05192546_10845 [Tindallia californiensis]
MDAHKNVKKQKKTEQEIYAEGFYLLYFGLLLMVLVRGLILNHSLKSIGDISVLFFLSSIYLVVRFAFQGSLHDSNLEKGDRFNTRKAVLRGVFSTFFFAILMFISNRWSVGSFANLFSIVVGMMVFFAFSVILPYLSYRRKKKNAPN